MTSAVDSLLQTLGLENLEHNLFRGNSPKAGWQRVFGGQVIGQALVAAYRTVPEERSVHSLHGYFLRGGDPSTPIIYEVDRIRDGGSFTTRRVVAIQHGQAIFSMSASFQVQEGGLSHQASMPDVPMPEDLPGEEELKERYLAHAPEPVRKYFERRRPIELRPVELQRYFTTDKKPPTQYVWVRATAPLPEEARIHECVLAYASDMTLLDTALHVHGMSVFNPKVQVASLDHAMWFHQPFKADEWLLYAQDAPASGGGRAFTRGSLFTREGQLVASTSQEGLMRLRQEKSEN
ncbi:acyl-CoA thioesterase II [Polycladidibacter hongkongensis]|uniref:acyl-CoA thioesterase II n=1 Tax=Polycladidibacter hongkongensis TaxID=1647556 RepID=UPI00082DF94A|nr:acyl-CoA thioesterase II [Pseudovibrio hongkongensis]